MTKSREKQKIKVALVGGGSISKKHLEAIKSLKKKLVLKSLCDKDPNVFNDKGIPEGVNIYNDLNEMLEKEDLDLISICTPSGLHKEQTIFSAQAKVNVITEKPMALTLADGEMMVKACNDNKVKLFVVKQNRTNPLLLSVKQAIDNNEFGKINLISSNVFWTRPQSYYDDVNWRGTKEMDGGTLMNQVSHYIDLLYWLCGKVTSVHSFSLTRRKIETEDSGVVNLKFKNGALGSLNFTMLTYPENFEGSLTVLGDKGTVRVGGSSLNTLEACNFKSGLNLNLKHKKENYLNKRLGHKLYYKNVIEVLENKSNPITDGKEGLESLVILEACYRSLDKKTSVTIP